MNDKLLSRITSIIAIVLLIVSIVLVGLVYLGGYEGELIVGEDVLDIPKYANSLIIWAYVLLGATAFLAVFFAIFKFVKNIIVNPKSGIKTIVTLVAFALIFIISWNLGSPDKVTIFGYEGNQNEGFWAQLTDMIIYAVYSLFALIAIAIVGSRIYAKLK